jgi:diadenosine tetraphosphate (Ap4A) HIT family hydrolase
MAVVNEAGAAARGHCIFFPRRHVARLDELEDAELTEMSGLIARVARALDLAQYNVLSNNGARAGQTVFHAHAHLVPKPDGATGLVAQAGLGVVDQTGVVDELRRRLGA